MPRSLFPPMALAPLRAVMEAELSHLATLTTTGITRLLNNETVTGPPTVVEDVPCFLGSPTPADREVAAARSIAMQFRFLLPLGTAIRIGTVATVEGADADGTAWTRQVKVTATDLPDELVRLCAAVDATLNQ